MQSSAASVGVYVTEAPEDRKCVLIQLRSVIQASFPNHQEVMVYGMVGYIRPGDTEPEVAFASQKRYISIYFPVPVVDQLRSRLDGVNCGKCCLRFANPEKLDFQLIDDLLAETRRQYGP